MNGLVEITGFLPVGVNVPFALTLKLAQLGGTRLGGVSRPRHELVPQQRGDLIRKFNGREVKNINALRSMVAQTELNKNVDLEIIRDGKPLNVITQVKEQPANYGTAQAAPRQGPSQPESPEQPNDQEDQEADGGPLSSIHVEELTPEMARQLDLPPNAKGVLVTGMDPDSGTPELQKGDVIEEISQQPVTSVSDYNKIAASLDPSQPQVLSVCRHRSRSFLVLRPR